MKQRVQTMVANKSLMALFGLFCFVTLPQILRAEDDHKHEENEKPGAGHAEEGKGHADHDKKADHAAEEKDHKDHGEGGHNEAEEGLIKLTDAQIKSMGVLVETAAAGEIRKELSLPGEIKLNSDGVAHIFPRFAGVVRQVRKNVGDVVKKGEVLATIESNESLTNYSISASVDGTIIEKHVTLGETIRDGEEVFVVADLRTVWVELNVFPKDLPQVKVGNDVRIVAGPEYPEGNGKISYLSPVVSAHTRTAVARVVLDNADFTWRPGLFVTAFVTTEAVPARVIVDKDALQTINGVTSVFVATEGGFRAREVSLGRQNGRSVEVLSGIAAGEKYVGKGSFILKAELGKSEAGHDHG